VIDKRDILRPDKLPECRFLDPDFPKLRACVAEMNGPARALFWFWAIGISLSRADFENQERVYLLDGYWMKQAAAEVVYGCDADWVLHVVSAFPKPDLTIYLDVSPEDALARKTERTPYECGRRGDLDAGAFLDHQGQVRSVLLEWCERFGWERLSTGGGADEVSVAVQGLISARLYSSVSVFAAP